MQRNASKVVYLGVGGYAVALDLATGLEIWRRKIKGAQLTAVALAEERLLVTANGEIWCLDRNSGEILWRNKLKGLGTGLVTVAGADMTPALAAALMAQQAAAAAAGGAAAASAAG
jgi:outer membrane protein assembly factor BamB